MQTKPFTLVVCPKCGNVRVIKKCECSYECHVCGRVVPDVDKTYKLGLKKNEKTGDEIWVGVKEE